MNNWSIPSRSECHEVNYYYAITDRDGARESSSLADNAYRYQVPFYLRSFIWHQKWLNHVFKYSHEYRYEAFLRVIRRQRGILSIKSEYSIMCNRQWLINLQFSSHDFKYIHKYRKWHGTRERQVWIPEMKMESIFKVVNVSVCRAGKFSRC